MRSKFFIYASLVVVVAASIGAAATFAYAASGQVALVKANINIVTPSFEKKYNGEVQEFTAVGASYEGELNLGDSILFSEVKTQAFNAGRYQNKVNYEILNANGQDAKKDYNIKDDFGVITIAKRKLNISIKEGCEELVPEGYSQIDERNLNIEGDGIAPNDNVTFYCNKKMSGNTFKFIFSIESYNEAQNVSTTRCYTVNQEPLYINGDELDLPPGVQLPNINDFPELPDIEIDGNIPDIDLPDGFLEFDESGKIEGGPNIENIASKTAIMKVKPDARGLYLLRGTSLGDYNFKGFEKPKEYNFYYGYNPNQYFQSFLSNKKKRKLEISYLNNFASKFDFAPYFCSNEDPQQNDITFRFEKGNKRTYTTYSYDFIPQTNLDVIESLYSQIDFSQEELGYRTFVHENYLNLPDENYKNKLISYLENKGVNIDSSLQEFNKALMRMFTKEFEYNLQAYEGTKDTVYEFLTSTKKGNCQNFASAATLLYRAKGIPARYTKGFFLFADQPNVTTVVTPLQAHAWVEIYYDGYGWLPLDYTIGDLENVFGEEEVDPEINDPNDSGILGENSLPIESKIPQTNYLADVKASEPGRYYLREESYGDFTLTGFAPANKYNVNENTNPNHFAGMALENIVGNAKTIDIEYKEKYGTRHKLTPTYFAGNDLIKADCDLYYEEASTNEMNNFITYDFDYLKDGTKLDGYEINDPILKKEEYNYYYFAKKYYLNVPSDVKAIVQDEILKYLPIIPDNPQLICNAVNSFFKQSKIEFDPRLELGYNQIMADLEGFFQNKASKCNAKSVATIATMLLRSLDIPTRIAKGFLYVANDTNQCALNNFNEHFWNEIYIKGIGWIKVDFLTSSEKIDDEYYEGKKHITIKADDYETYYNGDFQQAPDPYILEGEDTLEGDHFLDYSMFGLKNASSENINYGDIKICDFNFNDKTFHYAIDYSYGIMTVKKVPITIRTKSISEIYKPGIVLKTEIDSVDCVNFTIDDLNFVFKGAELNDVGSIDATIDLYSLEIIDSFGVDVTRNFDITIESGILELK